MDKPGQGSRAAKLLGYLAGPLLKEVTQEGGGLMDDHHAVAIPAATKKESNFMCS